MAFATRRHDSYTSNSRYTSQWVRWLHTLAARRSLQSHDAGSKLTSSTEIHAPTGASTSVLVFETDRGATLNTLNTRDMGCECGICEYR